MQGNLKERTGPNKAKSSPQGAHVMAPLPGSENMWLVPTPEGRMVSVQTAHVNRLTAFVRNVRVTPKLSDQSRLLGKLELNSK